MRKRFNPNAISSATPDGNTGYNHATHKAHIELVNKKHEEFITSGLNTTFMAVAKPKIITEEYLHRRYTKVRIFGEWVSISKFYGKLVSMYNDNFQFQ